MRELWADAELDDIAAAGGMPGMADKIKMARVREKWARPGLVPLFATGFLCRCTRRYSRAFKSLERVVANKRDFDGCTCRGGRTRNGDDANRVRLERQCRWQPRGQRQVMPWFRCRWSPGCRAGPSLVDLQK